MCTAATYKSADFYMGRTLDYEFSYGEEITVMPRRYPLAFRHGGKTESHYAIIIRSTMMRSMKKDSVWQG